MGTSDCLSEAIRTTHDTLTERFETARATRARPDDARCERAAIDRFVAAASKHLHAADAVLLPAARRTCPTGAELVRDCVRSVRALEVELAHLKAHEYGSTYERTVPWSRVWEAVETSLADVRRHEQEVADQLTDALPPDRQADLCDRLASAEARAPSRPHPYTPHTGVAGAVGRRLMGWADRFWDAAENRMVPEPERPPRKRPGLLAQYLLADPRFDEPEPPAERDTEERSPERAGSP